MDGISLPMRPMLFACLAIGVNSHSATASNVIYVDDDANGGDGTSWNSAHKFLQDALVAASQPGMQVSEIRVGQGTYRPDQNLRYPGGTGNRLTSFVVPNGVSLKGGFAGVKHVDPDAHDPTSYPTVLSGDLFNNDGPNFVGYFENSYHVLRTVQNTGPTFIIGMTIEGGNATLVSNQHDRGGGLWIQGGTVALHDCIIRANSAAQEGGIRFDATVSVELHNCTIEGNRGAGIGGIGIMSGAITFHDCSFIGNHATNGAAGGFHNKSQVATLDNCTFVDNFADGNAGAIYSSGSSSMQLVLDHCTFDHNTAGRGGALYLGNGIVTATESSWIGNVADVEGGAIFNVSEAMTLTHCDFIENDANGNDLYNGSAIWSGNSTQTLIDCLVRDNLARTAIVSKSEAVSTYIDCQFIGNASGAAYEDDSTFDYINCLFEDNFGEMCGVYAYGARSTGSFVGCTFLGNESALRGPLVLSNAETLVVGCDFIGNKAQSGGGSACTYGDQNFINCRYINNKATLYGGGIFAEHSQAPEIANCLFIKNSAQKGGAISVWGATPKIRNCTVVNNTSTESGGGIAVSDCYAPPVIVANCVLWQNTAAGSFNAAAQLFEANPTFAVMNYSCMQGWTSALGGVGNHGLDPLFANPVGDDGLIGTVDDDFRLMNASPCINAGSNTNVSPDVADLNGNSNTLEPIPLDLDWNPRFIGGGVTTLVDMGAFEFNSCPADIAPDGGDGTVDADDLITLIGAWGECDGFGCAADLVSESGMAIVDVDDLIALIQSWGPCK